MSSHIVDSAAGGIHSASSSSLSTPTVIMVIVAVVVIITTEMGGLVEISSRVPCAWLGMSFSQEMMFMDAACLWILLLKLCN